MCPLQTGRYAAAAGCYFLPSHSGTDCPRRWCRRMPTTMAMMRSLSGNASRGASRAIATTTVAAPRCGTCGMCGKCGTERGTEPGGAACCANCSGRAGSWGSSETPEPVTTLLQPPAAASTASSRRLPCLWQRRRPCWSPPPPPPPCASCRPTRCPSSLFPSALAALLPAPGVADDGGARWLLQHVRRPHVGHRGRHAAFGRWRGRAGGVHQARQEGGRVRHRLRGHGAHLREARGVEDVGDDRHAPRARFSGAGPQREGGCIDTCLTALSAGNARLATAGAAAVAAVVARRYVSASDAECAPMVVFAAPESVPSSERTAATVAVGLGGFFVAFVTWRGGVWQRWASVYKSYMSAVHSPCHFKPFTAPSTASSLAPSSIT